MNNFLVKESADYADEFNCEGFKIIKGESKENVIDGLIENQGGDFPMECCFGTNESLQFDNKNEFIQALNIIQITDEEVTILKKLFPNCDKHSFGTTGIL